MAMKAWHKALVLKINRRWEREDRMLGLASMRKVRARRKRDPSGLTDVVNFDVFDSTTKQLIEKSANLDAINDDRRYGKGKGKGKRKRLTLVFPKAGSITAYEHYKAKQKTKAELARQEQARMRAEWDARRAAESNERERLRRLKFEFVQELAASYGDPKTKEAQLAALRAINANPASFQLWRWERERQAQSIAV